MRAKIRKTGEIVDIIAYDDCKTRSVLDRVSYIDSEGVEHSNEHLNYYWDFELIEQPNFDSNSDEHWQYVKEYAAIAAMQGTITILGSNKDVFMSIVNNGFTGKKNTYFNTIAEFSVKCADALIEELKK